MNMFLKILGSVMLLAIIPVTLSWIWIPGFLAQFLSTDLVLLVAGTLTLGFSYPPAPKK